jgi:UDP-GlcNAc3NAcA epimerase
VRLFVTVIGARPQFVKAAAVSRVLRQRSGIREVLVHTGQHFDREMSDVFLEELGIPAPNYHLGVSGGGHGQMTGRMLASLEPILTEITPDCMLVYGDTNSTLAGALTAAKLQIPVAHVEAGLRSFNRTMPEETNRVVTDHLSSMLFCPSEVAVRNLAAEGIHKGVSHTGDVMFDAVLHTLERSRTTSRILEELEVLPGTYSVATVHRAENTNDSMRLRRVMSYLEARAEQRPIILPIHPRTRQALERNEISLRRIKAIPPVGYYDMLRLIDGAADVFTDSGGLQKEAYFLRRPCVTLRDETEWVETIDAGWNRLWTTPDYRPRREISDYGLGQASEIIADLLTGQK